MPDFAVIIIQIFFGLPVCGTDVANPLITLKVFTYIMNYDTKDAISILAHYTLG